MLRDPGLVFGRWARFFGILLNWKSDNLRLDIIEGFPQWPAIHALGVKLTENEVTAAMRSMANAKEVRPDELPVELLELGLNHYPTVLREFHRMIELVWRQRNVPQRWRDVVVKNSSQKEGQD